MVPGKRSEKETFRAQRRRSVWTADMECAVAPVGYSLDADIYS